MSGMWNEQGPLSCQPGVEVLSSDLRKAHCHDTFVVALSSCPTHLFFSVCRT